MKAIQPKLYTEGAERPETRAIRRPHRHASRCLRDGVRRPRSEVRGLERGRTTIRCLPDARIC